ncbi:MAG: chemotaxis protein CheW [bacterium]
MLSNQLDKKIALHIEGSENELDKTVIEKLSDPLNHLIRNAADHGIEPPDERLSSNKPVEGSIWLRAYQEEGKVILEIEDDGRGISHESVLNKAAEKGLYNGEDITEKDVYDFLMSPGFSTAVSISEISGRGVGLDVVKQNIEKLRGNMEIISEEGTGTIFRIKLPLTLAIIDGMKVSVGDEILTVPLLSIIEAVLPEKSMIKTIEGKGELIEFRGEFIPLVRMYEVFNFPTDITDPEDAVMMILEGHNRKLCIMVDDVLGQQQAVIKSLTNNYHQVTGVSGATILGSGKVSLIVDVHGLERAALNAQA